MKVLVRFLLPVLLLLPAACMPTPAQREAQAPKLDPTQACRAQCNRDNQVCGDQRAADTGGGVFGMSATCENELRACLARCGVAR